DRVREHAVLQTLGFKSHLIARLIIGEGLVLSLAGGLFGSVVSVSVLMWGRFALSVDGMSIPFEASAGVFASGLLVAAALGVLAGLVPAWQASRREIVACFRAV
ncbi:MAG: FtsX-like permease family protein, partial [Phycisphaerales bacterium]